MRVRLIIYNIILFGMLATFDDCTGAREGPHRGEEMITQNNYIIAPLLLLLALAIVSRWAGNMMAQPRRM